MRGQSERVSGGRWALVGVAVVALVGLGFALDRVFRHWFAQRGEAPLETLAQTVTHLGDWPALAVAVLLGVLVARLFRARRTMTVLCVMFAATLLAGAIVQPVRVATGRARPHPEKVGGWYGLRKDGKWIAGRHRYSSFPSAHTTVAAAFFTPLVVMGGARWLPVWLVALAVGWSRIYLGAHHPSDVVVGMLVGTGCGWIVARSPGIRWWVWRFASVLCGFRRLWPGRERSAAVLLGRSSV
jgi:membrane-associated phospholipid phosphatase